MQQCPETPSRSTCWLRRHRQVIRPPAGTPLTFDIGLASRAAVGLVSALSVGSVPQIVHRPRAKAHPIVEAARFLIPDDDLRRELVDTEPLQGVDRPPSSALFQLRDLVPTGARRCSPDPRTDRQRSSSCPLVHEHRPRSTRPASRRSPRLARTSLDAPATARTLFVGRPMSAVPGGSPPGRVHRPSDDAQAGSATAVRGRRSARRLRQQSGVRSPTAPPSPVSEGLPMILRNQL